MHGTAPWATEEEMEQVGCSVGPVFGVKNANSAQGMVRDHDARNHRSWKWVDAS